MKPIYTITILQTSFSALFKFIVANLWKLIIFTFCTYLLPTYEMIAVTIFLLVADMITGIWKSIKTGVPVTAQKIGVTTEKMFAYMLGIICAYVVQHNITSDLIKVMLIFTSLISFREFKSIVENIEVITNTKIWGYIVKQLGSFIPSKGIKTDSKDKETKDEPN
jgi:hypothetical protein